jgi:hypothetical protein
MSAICEQLTPGWLSAHALKMAGASSCNASLLAAGGMCPDVGTVHPQLAHWPHVWSQLLLITDAVSWPLLDIRHGELSAGVLLHRCHTLLQHLSSKGPSAIANRQANSWLQLSGRPLLEA